MMKNQLLTQFDLHHKLYNNVLDGFTDEETNQRLHADSKMNHVKYLAGHLLNAQYGLAMLAGIDPTIKWDNLFAAAGQSAARDDIEYPAIEKINREWNGMYEKTREGLQKLTVEDMDGKPPAPADELFPTVGEMWAFLNHHQAYHIGQVGILRRGFGKAPMSYD